MQAFVKKGEFGHRSAESGLRRLLDFDILRRHFLYHQKPIG
jgi:hypothetical protein